MTSRNSGTLLRHVDLILTLAEHGSLSAAAAALNLTQSALTKALHRAESDLQVPLFDRRPRGVEPTEFGRTLIEHAKFIRRHCQDAVNELDALAGKQGSVLVGAGASFLDALLPRAIARLVGCHPAMRITLQIEILPILTQRLREGHLDLLLVSELPDFGAAQDLVWTPLITDEMDVVARVGHPLTMRESVSLPELCGSGWVFGGERDPQQQRIEAVFRAHGLVPPEPTVKTVSRAVTVQIVRQSDLLALLPNSRFHPQSDGLARVPCAEATLRRVAGLVHRAGAVLPPAGKALAEELKVVCGEYHEKFETIDPASGLEPIGPAREPAMADRRKAFTDAIPEEQSGVRTRST